jgi:ApbE superfamily uncharacterized protein (UPF0280 family)
MVTAVWPFRAVFITPMAAVAGAVADELLQALLRGRTLAKACVNDGGDIALHLGAGESLRVAIVHDPARPACDAAVDIRAGLPVRGVATSGWRGRSHSLGIADAVTVLAANGAAADAAATLIANAVDIDHPGIERRPARSLREDSDLGEIPVTVHVPPLSRDAVRAALENGRREAEALHARGLVHAACLALQGETLAYPASLPLKLSSTSSAALSQGGSRP